MVNSKMSSWTLVAVWKHVHLRKVSHFMVRLVVRSRLDHSATYALSLINRYMFLKKKGVVTSLYTYMI